jgi:hypothetical protein
MTFMLRAAVAAAQLHFREVDLKRPAAVLTAMASAAMRKIFKHPGAKP